MPAPGGKGSGHPILQALAMAGIGLFEVSVKWRVNSSLPLSTSGNSGGRGIARDDGIRGEKIIQLFMKLSGKFQPDYP